MRDSLQTCLRNPPVRLMSTESWTAEALESEQPLSITVLHTGNIAAQKVKKITDRILQNIGGNCPPRIEWLAFDSLSDKKTFAISSHAASQADLLFVALDSSTELSCEIKAWLSAVLRAASQRPRALVAVLETNDAPAAWHRTVDTYLRDQAQRARVDYFIHLA